MSDILRERIRYFGFAGFIGGFLLLNALGILTTIFGIDTAAMLALLAGYKIFYNAISDLLDKKISADLAICIAAIAALTVGEYLAAAEAMLIMLIGEGLEAYAAGRTQAAIHKFVEQLPRYARVLRNGVEVEIDPSELRVNEVVVIRPGERISADGIVLDGTSSVDESTITGEPLPCDKLAGDEVYSGSLNGNGSLRVQVMRAGNNTTLAQVARLVEEAQEKRAPVERLADHYARYFLPGLLLAGALTFYLTRDWMRTVAVLIVACPCALVLATPTAMVAAIGGLARRGILVKGARHLEQLAKANCIVFDKTGTLTEGKFEILKVIPFNRTEAELLTLAASAEANSEHPLAVEIRQEALRRQITFEPPRELQSLPGRGVECHLSTGSIVRAGNAMYLSELGISGHAPMLQEADRLGATAILVAEDSQLAGAILLRDRVRTGTRQCLAHLKHQGYDQHFLLTGDRRRAAEVMAREVGIAEVEAELLPEDKLERIRHFQSTGKLVVMVGDGINDAPALATADVGIAVGPNRAEITAAAADVVYLNTSLEHLPIAFLVSRQAVTTAWQNILLFALAFNVLAVLAASVGIIGPVSAAVVHQLSSFFVMINSLRLLRVEREKEEALGLTRWYLRSPVSRLVSSLGRLLGRFDPAATFRWTIERRNELLKPALLIVLVLYLGSGAYILQPDELGIIERFGKKVPPYHYPGLHYHWPWPIESLNRLQVERVRLLEIGYRTIPLTSSFTEPVAYEWNIQHRFGRYSKKQEEALMLTGDQNMVEVTAAVHYKIERPDDFLFRHVAPETALRVAAESSLQSCVSMRPLDYLLTTGRREIETLVAADLQRRIERYGAGVRILGIKLQDVHPPLEVVDAFRQVASAAEDKSRLINESEGHRNEQIAFARGHAEALTAKAEAYSQARVERAMGDANHFLRWEQEYRRATKTTSTRLYLETMEEVLPGRDKVIIDSRKVGRRHLTFLEDGLTFPAEMFASPRKGAAQTN